MGTSFEDLVTDSLRRRAAAVRIPAGLADSARGARRQHRRRQYLVRTGLTAVTAAGLAVVVPLATQTGPQVARSSTSPAQTLAYVVHHAERSMEASAATDIEVARDTYPAPGFGWSFPNGSKFAAHGTTTWSYGISLRVMFYAADARPILDDSWVYPAPLGGRAGAGSRATVDYVARTFSRTTLPAPVVNNSVAPPSVPASCHPKALPVFLTPIGDWTPTVPWLRYGLRCGSFRLAGRQYVAGVNAIKIVAGHASDVDVIWVSPTTYLPVQSLSLGILAEYRWLPATRLNLALLSAPIPAGFRRVKPAAQ